VCTAIPHRRFVHENVAKTRATPKRISPMSRLESLVFPISAKSPFEGRVFLVQYELNRLFGILLARA
jgi:hypothetical protein